MHNLRLRKLRHLVGYQRGCTAKATVSPTRPSTTLTLESPNAPSAVLRVGDTN
jgi:hypothetical protein